MYSVSHEAERRPRTARPPDLPPFLTLILHLACDRIFFPRDSRQSSLRLNSTSERLYKSKGCDTLAVPTSTMVKMPNISLPSPSGGNLGRTKNILHFVQALHIFVAWAMTIAIWTKGDGIDGRTVWYWILVSALRALPFARVEPCS